MGEDAPRGGGFPELADSVRKIAERFADERQQRLGRRELHRDDFDALSEAGFLRVGVPSAMGGLFDDVGSWIRPTAELLRSIARGDPAVALVAAMHPAVLLSWLAFEQAPDRADATAWEEQRRVVFQSALDGHWWGTISSEPGSGGDLAQTRATAVPTGEPLAYRVTGEKHFGSGSGLSSFMITSARPDGEDAPATFFIDMRGRPWDGTAGVELTRPWDGVGMRATQSHAARFTDIPATRMAARVDPLTLLLSTSPAIMVLFTSVFVGVVDTAVAEATARLRPKADRLRPYEQVEWSDAVTDAWLMRQAYEGGLRAVETSQQAVGDTLRAKTAAARLAESCLGSIARVIGGGAYSESSPFAHWAQDVRALGYLRPPWGYQYDSLYLTSWS